MRTEEVHLDVLQNIEFAIMQAQREAEELSGYDVQSALEALLKVYKDELKGSKSTRRFDLHVNIQIVFVQVREVLEWRLGRKSPVEEMAEAVEPSSLAERVEPNSLVVIIACLQKIRNSVRRWNKKGGSTGYLNFIQKFVA